MWGVVPRVRRWRQANACALKAQAIKLYRCGFIAGLLVKLGGRRMKHICGAAGGLALGLWIGAAAAQPAATATPAAPPAESVVAPADCPDIDTAVPAVAPPPPAAADLPPGSVVIPSGIAVDVMLTQQISSATLHRGDCFGIALGAPIVVDGREIAPAGALGVGQVIDSRHGGMGGNPGILMVAARYVTVRGVRVPLRGFHFSSNGQDNTNVSMAISTVGAAVLPALEIAAILIPGGNVMMMAHMHAEAHTRAAVALPPPEPAAPEPSAATAPSASPPSAATAPSSPQTESSR
jgi:hypothetical protein